MKKLLFLLVFIFISSSSFSQVIIHKQYIKRGVEIIKVITEEINITEIQDEYIEIKLSVKLPHRHLLSTTEYKNVSISASSNKKRWNVYDGDKLIYLNREVDVLNYFNKYGFEFFKRKFSIE
ncbi:MAG: hypothetical protein P8K72_00840 [Flavobacteriaceae bacterium]|nr:hypothetical protein [Flavobacteriaceae bacterium]